jgi:hypothetical protein
MVPQELPPGLSQYLGPAFTPLIAILWHVVGEPILQLVALFFAGPAFAAASTKVGEGLGALIGGLIVFAMAIVGAIVVVAAFVLILFTTGVTLAFWRERD